MEAEGFKGHSRTQERAGRSALGRGRDGEKVVDLRSAEKETSSGLSMRGCVKSEVQNGAGTEKGDTERLKQSCLDVLV